MENEEIFEIEGVSYKRSKDKLKDGDEVFWILKDDPLSNIPYGTKGFVVST